LFDYVGTPTTIKVLGMVEEAKIPLLGMFTGAEELRTPFKKYVFNVRSSYYAESKKIVDYAVENKNFSKIAVFYQDDAFGLAVLKGTNLIMTQHSLEIVSKSTYIRGTLDVEKAIDIIKVSKPEAIILVGTYTPLAKFINLYESIDSNVYFYTVSFVAPDKFAYELKQYNITDSEKIVVSQVMPAPYENLANSSKTVVDYIEQSKKYFPEIEPNYVGLEGYVNAIILVEALHRAGIDLDRKKFIEALESMNQYDLGIGFSADFGPEDHQAFDRVYLSSLQDSKFLFFDVDNN
jgi:ABC-type branched-subunit amino acid transport system substrate-binding protein